MFRIFTATIFAFLSVSPGIAVGQNPPHEPQANSPSSSIANQAAVVDGTVPGSFETPLWRGLLYGMDRNAVAAHLRTLPEVAHVEVRSRRNREPEIVLRYNGDGLSLFGFKLDPSFEFESNALTAVTIRSKAVCTGPSFDESSINLVAGLREKYPRQLRVVDEHGVPEPDKIAFTDGTTQVMVTISISAPPSAREVASANLDAALARSRDQSAMYLTLLASRLERERDNALTACPRSEGQKANVILQYNSHTVTLDEMERRRIQEDNQNRRDIDKL